MALIQSYRDLIELNKHFRIKIEKQLLQGKCGVYIHTGLAIIAFMSSVVYVTLTFYPEHYPIMMRDWFDTADYIICVMLLVQYSLQMYVTMQRSVYLRSTESLLCLFIMVPILTN